MKLITLYLPETYIKMLDELVDEKLYPNRAEAIRIGIRTILSEHNKFEIVYTPKIKKSDYMAPTEHQQTAIEHLVELQSRRHPR